MTSGPIPSPGRRVMGVAFAGCSDRAADCSQSKEGVYVGGLIMELCQVSCAVSRKQESLTISNRFRKTTVDEKIEHRTWTISCGDVPAVSTVGHRCVYGRRGGVAGSAVMAIQSRRPADQREVEN
nr:hypothetical protein Iba_chr11aCG17810 [Ipomoea batatas]